MIPINYTSARDVKLRSCAYLLPLVKPHLLTVAPFRRLFGVNVQQNSGKIHTLHHNPLPLNEDQDFAIVVCHVE